MLTIFSLILCQNSKAGTKNRKENIALHQSIASNILCTQCEWKT